MQESGNKENKINGIRQAIKHTTFYYVKRIVFSGFFITALLLVAQIAFFILMCAWLSTYVHLYFEGSIIFSVIFMMMIINNDSNPAYKIAWIILIALFPIGGCLLYLYVKYNIGTIATRKIIKNISVKIKAFSKTEDRIKESIFNEHSDIEKLSNYLEKEGGCPTFNQSEVNYYPLGDDCMEPIIAELEKAKEFIFMEFFMVEEGVFFNRVLDVLERKAKEGVEVRFMYDDLGCVALLPRNYIERLRQKGIMARTHAHLTPFLSTHYNNRDHRKIIVVDGKWALTGGINLCDEYINAFEKYGHWKDNAVSVRGDAVKGFTLLYLQMWNSESYSTATNFDYSKYLKTYPVKGNGGYIIPYGDGPHQDELVAENVYMDILNNAKDYVYIMTPYLILDYEMEKTIKHAAMSGIDVRIILPSIPDKKIAFDIARTYYLNLLHAGVKLYEYTPGFIHAKTFLSDDRIGVVGTINLDYRSLYLHYECGCILYKNEILSEIKKDFINTFSVSTKVDSKYYHNIFILRRFIGRIFRVFGPLM